MIIQVAYVRQIEKDGKTYSQHVTQALELKEDAYIAAVTDFYVQYPWQPDQPMVYRPQPVLGW